MLEGQMESKLNMSVMNAVSFSIRSPAPGSAAAARSRSPSPTRSNSSSSTTSVKTKLQLVDLAGSECVGTCVYCMTGLLSFKWLNKTFFCVHLNCDQCREAREKNRPWHRFCASCNYSCRDKVLFLGFLTLSPLPFRDVRGDWCCPQGDFKHQ